MADRIKPKICVVSTTPLTIHFFLKPHLLALSRFADVVLAVNPLNDAYTPELPLPVRIEPISIKREISLGMDLLTLYQLYRLFRRERPDLVWAVTPKGGLLGMLASRLAGVKRRVFIFQGEVWASRTGVMRQILKLADRVCACCATTLLAVSASERSFLEQEGVVAAGKVQVLGNGSICGVDLNKFKADTTIRQMLRGQLGISDNAVVALFAGRLTRDKGIFELAGAFHNLVKAGHDLWLLIVGPDEQDVSTVLRTSLGEAASRCHLIGFSNHLERYMNAADYICLPSTM